jgi:hypothetical protein
VRQIAALVSLMLALASPEALAQARMNMPSLPLPSLGPAPLPVPNPAPTAPLPPPPAGQVGLFLSAAFAGDNKPIRSGLVWRVYEDRGDAAEPTIVARSTNPAPNFNLPPGNYLIHVAYGFAGASKRLTVQSGSLAERLTISAGALKLGGAVAEQPIPASRISFAVYVPIGANSEGRLVLSNGKAGDIIRLPEGTYHVVSTYGDSNAIMRTDLKVETGRVTEATLNHRAATVTLKLVATEGGEAFAGTAFSVLTPGGDVIREAIGAFPSVTLAEGDYTLIARHEGQVYTREFKVQNGLNRDIEILARK